MIGDFHFIRPWCLLALVPIAIVLWRLIRGPSAGSPWHGIVSPHLLPHLLIQPSASRGRMVLISLAMSWVIAAIAIAGPTWRREPAPFADDIAAMVIVLKVTPSMRTQDVQPDRLARSVQKIGDLLKRRPGAKTALIVYSGSVHSVVPLTGDATIVSSFAADLDPAIMPIEGDVSPDAIAAAGRILNEAGTGGSVLWIADAVAPEARQGLSRANANALPPVHVLAAVRDGPEFDSLHQAAGLIDVDIVRMSPNDDDVDKLSRDTRFAEVDGPDTSARWRESGYALVPLILLLGLVQFRRGAIGSLLPEGGAS